MPLADVSVEYEILGSGSDSNKVLQKFSDVTDANGYSVVFRNVGDLEPRQIGVVATDLKAPRQPGESGQEAVFKQVRLCGVLR